MSGRVRLPARTRTDFMDRAVVDCPRCDGYATVTTPGERPEDRTSHQWLTFGPKRMVCRDCGASTDQPETPMGVLARPTMGLTPRLRAETRHGVLVALNEAELDYLEAYVGGRLREEVVEPGGPKNRTVISRLPTWAKASKNRDEVLRAIRKVRETRL